MGDFPARFEACGASWLQALGAQKCISSSSFWFFEKFLSGFGLFFFFLVAWCLNALEGKKSLICCVEQSLALRWLQPVPGGAGLPGELRQKGALSALPFAFNPGDSISIQPWQPGVGGGRFGA